MTPPCHRTRINIGLVAFSEWARVISPAELRSIEWDFE
jgi:hypothetical protein